MPDFTPPISLSNPVIPAKAGIQTAANDAGTPANVLCQHALETSESGRRARVS